MVTDEMIEAFGNAFWSVNAASKIDGQREHIRSALEAALSTDAEPVAWIVRNPTVARTHSKTQAHKSSKEALYPVSRGEDAREYARLMGGECLPLYTHSLEAEQEENAAEGKCQENDGCPTEKAVLQRFWRRHHNAEPVAFTNAAQLKKLSDPSRWHEATICPVGDGAYDISLYAEPVKTAPAVAVKALQEIAANPADDVRGIAKKALSTLSAQVQDVAGWQPIETAPRDGSEFQAWIKDYGWEPKARINLSTEAFEIWGRIDYDEEGWAVYPHMVPTHWMPLPASPASKHGDAE